MGFATSFRSAPTLSLARSRSMSKTNEAELALPIPAAGAHHVRIRSLEPGSPPGPWGTPQLVEVPHDHWPALLILVPVLLFAL